MNVEEIKIDCPICGKDITDSYNYDSSKEGLVFIQFHKEKQFEGVKWEHLEETSCCTECYETKIKPMFNGGIVD